MKKRVLKRSAGGGGILTRNRAPAAKRPTAGFASTSEPLEQRRMLAAAAVATLVKDVTATDLGSAPQQFVAAGGRGYFVASQTVSGTTTYSVHSTDATAAGTTALG